MSLDLSLVIPCYREGTHIEKSFPELIDAMRRCALDYEIIFIDDQSPDDTVEKLTRLTASAPMTRLERNSQNLGRGGTVMRGFRMSTAKVVGFIDIDLSTPPLYVPHLTHLILEDRTDVATCHRSYKVEPHVLHRVWLRYLLSYGYRCLSRWYLGHGLRDTETGCKCFNRTKILPLLSQIEDPRWFWDTEIMVYAWLEGLRIEEVKSIFIRRPEKPSTVKIWHDVVDYLRNLVVFRKKVRRRLEARLNATNEALSC